jgi:hypothetical protein
MAAPNYQFLVNGVDLSAYLRQDGWNVTQNFGRQGDTGHFEMVDDFATHIVGGIPTPNFIIKPLQSVQLKTTVVTNLDTTIFAGRVTTPNFASTSPVANDWILDCVDYTSDTDNVIVSGDFNGWTADAIIKNLVSQANVQFVARGGSAITTNHVTPGPVIQRVQINYLTLSTAIVKVTRLASQYVDYAWYIDYARDLHFMTLQGQTGSPVATFTDSVPTGAPTLSLGYFLSNNYAYEWDGTSMRNSMIVRGTTFQTNFHDVFVGNGSQTSWPLTYHVTSTSTASLTVAAGSKTVTVVDNVGSSNNTSNVTSQFIITMNKNGQWFLQVNPGFGTTPGRGAAIRLSYTFDAPILARSDNVASQTQYTGTNGGMYQGAISDSSLVTVSSAVQRGEVELQAYQWVQERVTFTTVDNWPGHISAGQTFTLVSARTPDSQNSYAMGLNGTFMVVSNTYGGTRGNYRGYTITGTRIQ